MVPGMYAAFNTLIQPQSNAGVATESTEHDTFPRDHPY